jgi:hypothetical protein
VVGCGPPAVLACLVKGLVSQRDYALAHFIALGVRGGTLVVPMAHLPIVETAVSYSFGRFASSRQWFGGEEWCGAVAVVFEGSGLVVRSTRVAGGVIAYLGCRDRENFDGGGVHVERCGAVWSGEFGW